MQTWRYWILYWGAWALVGVYMSSMDVAHYHIPWGPNLAANLFLFLLWGLLALGIRKMLRWVPFRNTFRPWLFHIGASLLITAVSVILVHFFFQVLQHHAFPSLIRLDTWKLVLLSLRTEFQSNFLVYWGAAGAFLALDARGHAHLQQVRAVQLEAQLGQAKLQALQMQLNPHFLFNTLNTVASLIHSDPENADRMLARLSGFLRLTLELSADPEHSLRQELIFARSYLAIEHIRFRDRLQVEEDIDESLLDACVPVLLLQPLLENALRHGIERLGSSGHLMIRAQRHGDRLCLWVSDDGPGCAPSRLGTGIGTANTLARLKELYGSDQSFQLGGDPGGGTNARVEIPLTWTEQGAGLFAKATL